MKQLTSHITVYASGRVKDLFHSQDGDLNRKKEQYIIQKLCELCCIVLNNSQSCALVGEPNAMLHCAGIMYLAIESVSFELRSVQS